MGDWLHPSYILVNEYTLSSQENGPELSLEIAINAYPYIIDLPDGTQRLLDVRNRLTVSGQD